MWNCHRSTDKRYSGDNRLIGLESSHRQPGLAPRHIQGWSEGNFGHALANNGGAASVRKHAVVIPWEVKKQNKPKRKGFFRF